MGFRNVIMNLLKIWLIPHDSPATKDDTIFFERTTNESDIINVKYTPGDVKVSYNFTLNRDGTQKYISNLLTSLTKDADPWKKIQIAPANGPTIMYYVVDIEESMESIMETVDNLVYSTITTVPVPSRA
jgi:hypothetical protein